MDFYNWRLLTAQNTKYRTTHLDTDRHATVSARSILVVGKEESSLLIGWGSF